jgi:hypothetical protein
MNKSSHKGIAYSQGYRRVGPDHKPEPSSPNPRQAVCNVCDSAVHFVRRSYGPNGRAAHWQHTGDGLAQYRSWGLGR